MIDKECILIAANQQRFSLLQADAIQREVNMLAEERILASLHPRGRRDA